MSPNLVWLSLAVQRGLVYIPNFDPKNNEKSDLWFRVRGGGGGRRKKKERGMEGLTIAF